MNSIEDIGGAILIGFIFLLPLLFLYSIFHFLGSSIIDSVQNAFPKFGFIGRGKFKNTQYILEEKFSYYRRLNDADKVKFQRRVIRFIADKEFKAMGTLELTEEMKVLIAASAVQLTFGLDDYLLSHFSKIFIYPGVFYSRSSKQYSKGETNAIGAIVLSWSDFQKGYLNEKDNINLGLHEMAHALKLDQLRIGSDTTFAAYMAKWRLTSQEEFEKLKKKEDSVLREYGGTNTTEFFSVCIEYFFESPKDFRTELPVLYRQLSVLLNQDPTENDIPFKIENTSIPDEPSGPPLGTFETDGSGLGRFAFIALVFIGFGILMLYNDPTNPGSYIQPLAGILILLYTFIQTKKYATLYSDRLVLSPVLIKKFEISIAREDLVAVSFERTTASKSWRRDQERNMIRLRFMKNGEVKNKRYEFDLPLESIMKMKEILATQNVPVAITSELLSYYGR